MHRLPHPLAGKTVKISLKGKPPPDIPQGSEFRVEDYWDRVNGRSWMDSDGSPAAMLYSIRSGFVGLPCDDEVVYGKVGAFGHLVHVSELVEAKS